MWCDRCRADAAAEVSAETGRAACATCGSDLGTVRRPATDQARELLKRWSAGIDLEAPPEPLAAAATTAKPEPRPVATADGEKRVRARRPSAPPRPATTPLQVRIDTPHPRLAAPQPVSDACVDIPHSGGPAPPHFDVHTAIATKTERRGHGAQIAGQILAYSGVLALTLGTALVIWGYFGGPPEYAPTGWLIATGGQMLLFLGVVTLVAGGLEQTSQDVRVRVESIGERLVRIEQAAAGHAIKGPHSAPEAYVGRHTASRATRGRV